MYQIDKEDIISAFQRPSFRVAEDADIPDATLIRNIVKNAPLPTEAFPGIKLPKDPAKEKPVTKPKKPAHNENIFEILRQVQGNAAGAGPQKGDPLQAPQVEPVFPNVRPGFARPVHPIIMPGTLGAQQTTNNDYINDVDNSEEEDFD